MWLRHAFSAASIALIATSLSALACAQTPPSGSSAPPPSAPPVISPSPADTPDAAMMARLRDEEMKNSQVMQTALTLTDVMGPRLTGSQGQKRATLWAKDQLNTWGLSNAHVETWGPFGRGWDLERFSAQVMEPVCIPLIAAPKAWSPGTRRPVNAEAIFIDARTVADLAAYKGRLKGKAVLVAPERPLAAHFDPIGERYTPEGLVKLTIPQPPGGRRMAGAPGGPGGPGSLFARFREQQQLVGAINQMCRDEGAAVVVDCSRGDGGTIFAQSASVLYGTETPQNQRHYVWEKEAPIAALPQVLLASEQYNRIVRMLKAGQTVKLNVDLGVKFTDSETEGLVANTIAELPGSDKKDEIVMCGAHLDSWHSSTGATDNACGCAVCMEAIRLLKSLGVTPRRTIRIALWTGEEEGLYGSSAYCTQHFGTRDKLTPEQSKVSVYFNLDNGTGKVRGIWGQGNTAVLPIFQEWLKPFNDLGASTVTVRNTGSTDHIPFDRVGIPGFQFIQDEIEYETRTHHSNQDGYDRLQADDLKQASLLMAAFLYDAAMREEPLPRKPFPPTSAPAAPTAAPR